MRWRCTIAKSCGAGVFAPLSPPFSPHLPLRGEGDTAGSGEETVNDCGLRLDAIPSGATRGGTLQRLAATVATENKIMTALQHRAAVFLA